MSQWEDYLLYVPETGQGEYIKYFQHCLSISDIYLLYEQTCRKTSMFHKAWYLASLIFP